MNTDKEKLMSYTVEEIKELLAEREDPDFIVDILEITSEDLVEHFTDNIELKYELLNEYFEEEHRLHTGKELSF